ncbi:MAG: hypothetical protein U1E18_23510 [Brevundimonas sp.]|uniref:hypothetical protein n=1 Tax=Brevundimonas sp. TaxID=1871086 RepID=UPI0027222E6B|nr:hypothetical protein [Brevundimonas sp.]MDO9586563.1 hypothetical protein [Brevundimonas sp.]MDP3368559.1 hypothetical protein [Brevundimonas sp.]MDZ4112544.1 hypothetical protein [Brevundimonas sp.]
MLGTFPKFPRLFLVLAAIPVSLLLAQCGRDEPEPVDAEPVVVDPAPPPSITAPTALTRAGLLAAMSRAASTYAAGERSEGSDPLVGRSFALRVPFGCNGPQPTGAEAAGDGLARWSWGPESRTIQLSLTPGDWLNTALISGAANGSDWEAVEGFWIPRPWLAAGDCSTIRADPLQSGDGAPSPQTVGLAAVFKSDDSRVGRRNGQAYGFTIRPTGDTPLVAPVGGYRVILEGRLTGFPDGQAIRCRASSPDQRPVCIAAIRLDRVAFTTADSSVLLSEWRPG